MTDINIEKKKQLIAFLDNKLDNDKKINTDLKFIKLNEYILNGIQGLYLGGSFIFFTFQILLEKIDLNIVLMEMFGFLFIYIYMLEIFMKLFMCDSKTKELKKEKLSFTNEEFTQVSNILDKYEFYNFLDKAENYSLEEWIAYMSENKKIIAENSPIELTNKITDPELIKELELKKEQKILENRKLYVERLYKK